MPRPLSSLDLALLGLLARKTASGYELRNLSTLLALYLGVELLRTRSAWYQEAAAKRG